MHITDGLPGLTVVGLPDTSCREARDRVRAAMAGDVLPPMDTIEGGLLDEMTRRAQEKLLVFQVQAYLDYLQATNIARASAMMIVLWAITYALSNIFIKQWLKLRERAHGAS